MIKKTLFIFLFCFYFFQTISAHIVINSIYGGLIIKEPVLVDLINNINMQRLKKIHQYGIDYYTYQAQEYDRYVHSIGVFVLARKYGASIEEQIASLLHDVSHTAFSHVADFCFKESDCKDSYQDDIHEQFIENSSIRLVLNKHGFKVQDILHKNKKFKILEQEIPNICADRLEYNLYGGLIDNLLNFEDINLILNNLKFQDEQWFFENEESAVKFALVSLQLTERRWADPNELLRNIWMCDIIKKSIEINLITVEDMHFGTDDNIWNVINSSNNSFITDTKLRLFNPSNYYKFDKNNFDLFLKAKFRGIDPLVKLSGSNNKLYKLTQINSLFKKEYERVAQKVERGFYIKFNY